MSVREVSAMMGLKDKEKGFEAMDKKAIALKLALMGLCCILSCLFIQVCADKYGILARSFIEFFLNLLPIMAITSLYGMDSAIMCYSVVFFYGLVTAPRSAYLATVYLIAIFTMEFCVRYRSFRSEKHTFIAAAISSVIVGSSFYCVYVMVGKKMFSSFNIFALLYNILMAFPQILILYFLLFALYRYCPIEIAKCFKAHSFMYALKQKHVNDKLEKYGYKKRLSEKITRFHMIEALVLGIGAAAFANFLIPELYGDGFSTGVLVPQVSIILEEEYEEGYEEDDDDDEDDDEDEGTHKKRATRLTVNERALAFDLKMILLLIDLIIPLVQFINATSQKLIALPIQEMAIGMKLFTDYTCQTRDKVASEIGKLNIRTGDEIEMLYDTLVSTVNEVTEYIAKIEDEQRLKEALRAAEAANEAKNTFLSNVSHEIRTPINAVLGMDEMILRESDNKDIKKYAMDIRNSGKTLLGLINDILDFSKIEAGKMEIIPVQYEVSSALNDLVNMIGVKARDKNLKLIVNVDEKLPHLLYGDEIRVKQCALNILTNAVKYTEKGSVTMNVGYEVEDGQNILLKFQIVDTGIGIRQEDLKKLYSPFERIEEVRNRTIEGTGLGMSIVKQLLSMMDSQLVVKSVYGEGSDFSFAVRQKAMTWEPIGNFTEMYEKSLETTEEYHESFHAPDAHILVVDDTKMNLTVVRGLLKETQIKIDTAESGSETLTLVAKNKYDIIFLDQRMPVMDGIETLHAMQHMEGNLNIGVPCIALTANAISGAREMFLQEGFDDYVSKPVDGSRLEKLIRKYLPSELVIKPGDKSFDEGAEAESDGENEGEIGEGGASSSREIEIIKAIEEIDYKSAVRNCMNDDILLEAAKDFIGAALDNSAAIEGFWKSGDLKNYTIKVHALKSSSRLIGAMGLSEKAAYLEKCGDDGKKDEIDAKTPDLLAYYRQLYDKLSKIEESNEADDRELIEPERLQEAYMAIAEMVRSFDFDGADDVLKMLEVYRIPDDEAEKYNNIKKLVSRLDRDGLLMLF